MPGASNGAVSITTAGGTASASSSFTVSASKVPNSQQGNKLVGTGNVGTSQQGYSVALSSDGNTAIVGGWKDNNGQGAAWIYTRSGSTWTQQADKLVGTGGSTDARQGTSVAISADGNTVLIGGYYDNNLLGAAWVFTRNNSSWTQQGTKLVGQGYNGAPQQGYSVALSADGNTALIGAPLDNGAPGAVWVFTRNSTVWSQQGSKLVGTGYVGQASQGISVSISADGNTAIVGGHTDGNNQGAAWVYTRNANVWSQQGDKIVGTGGTNDAQQGFSVGLSADGNTAIIGGRFDNNHVGAAWIFTRNNTSWIQQGSKLSGNDITGTPWQGSSVGISADGNTAIVGGWADNGINGASWIYARNGNSWLQQGTKITGNDNSGAAQQGFSVALSADGNTAIQGGLADNGQLGAAWIFTNQPSSNNNNANLNTLGISSASLRPDFDPNTLNYNVAVPNNRVNVTVFPTFDSTLKRVSLRINGGAYATMLSGIPSGQLALSVGNNTIEILDSAQDGVTTKTYSISVVRADTIIIVTPQAPVISYPSTESYIVGDSITAVVPTNTGSAIPNASIYVSTYTGNPNVSNPTNTVDSIGINSSIKHPYALTKDSLGNLYVVEPYENIIRKINLDGTITTIAGSGSIGYIDSTGTNASFNFPSGITIDASGNLFIADTNNDKIRKITPNGTVTTYAGSGITGSHDGPASTAMFYRPSSLVFDTTGNLYVTDAGNNTIRKITPDGNVSTFAGSGNKGFANGQDTAASFNNPNGIAIDAQGNLYIGDANNHAIRKITQTGLVSTFAGNGNLAWVDGIGTNASLGWAAGMVFDAIGDMYFVDADYGRLRKITPTGVVTTLVGNDNHNSTDGPVPTASFGYPTSLVLDASHNMYITDYASQLIRKVTFSGYTISPNLPGGLSFDANTGTISGTPTDTSSATDYHIMAFNGSGTGSATINIEVLSAGGGVSGGITGGLESKSLGDAVVKRVYTKALTNQNGPVYYDNMPLVNNSGIRIQTTGIGTSIKLSGIMPDITSKGFVAYNSSPQDIISITNASEVMATDFTVNQQCKAVAFATKTSGELYDHTKPICDRLKGASLNNVEKITIGGFDFVKYTLTNPQGQKEFATSFSVGTKTGRSNLSFQSTWLMKDYIPDETMYNFQLWAASPDLVTAMINDVLTKLKAFAPVKSASTIGIPATYILSGKRDGQNLNLVVSNNSSNINGYFTLEDKSNESNISISPRQVPFTLNASGVTNVSIPMSDLYESNITMYINGQMKDAVYMSDGTWYADYNKATTTINNFTISNDAKRSFSADEFPLMRNVAIQGNSTDYVSIIKLLKGGGMETDSSNYKGLKITASGGYNLHVTLIKNSTVNWKDQYYADIKLDQNQKDYYISLDKFVSDATKDKIKATDITTVVFSLDMPGGGINYPINSNFSNISFTKVDLDYIASLESKEVQVFPNPTVGGKFICSFKSDKDADLTLFVNDITGRQIHTQRVSAIKGDNKVPVTLSNSINGMHIISLEGANVKYDSKKLSVRY